MKATVHITLKNGVLDPQGKATQHALENLGFKGVESVRIGKYIEVELAENDRLNAEGKVKEMCEKLLANTVVENFRVDVKAS